jgi:hypothetical protein
MNTWYAGWIGFKNVNIQACILGGYCILYICFYSLLEAKTKSENLSIGDMY